MGHWDTITLQLLSGHENGCFPSAAHYQLMIMQNFANYLKFSETLARLSSALSYTIVVSNLSFTGWMHFLLYYCCGQFLFSMMAPCAPDHQDYIVVTMSPMFVWPRPSTLRPGLTSLLTPERGLIMARPGCTRPGTRRTASPDVWMLKSCTNTRGLNKAGIYSSLLRLSNQKCFTQIF